MNYPFNLISKWPYLRKTVEWSGYYCWSFNISIIKQLLNIKCFATFNILRSLSTLKFKLCTGIHSLLLRTVNPAYFDLIGHLNHFDIDERCQTAEADQPKNQTDASQQQQSFSKIFKFWEGTIWPLITLGYSPASEYLLLGDMRVSKLCQDSFLGALSL